MARWGIGTGQAGLRRRRAERQLLAAEQGWDFHEESPELAARWHEAVPVGAGGRDAASHARFAATGMLDGHRVTVFDLVGGGPDGDIRTVHLVELPCPLPLVAVARHTLALDTLLPLLRRRVLETPGRHLYESGDPEYDAVHLVETTDPGLAARLLTPAVREYADDRRWLEWRVDDRWLCYAGNPGPAAAGENPPAVLRSLARLVDLADPALWGDQSLTRKPVAPAAAPPRPAGTSTGPSTARGGPGHAGFHPWSTRLPERPGSAPAVRAGTLYQAAGPHCYALDALTGRLRWRHQAQDRLTTTPAVAGDTVYLTGEDGLLRALDATDGAERWSTRVGTCAAPTVADGVVYTVTTSEFRLQHVRSSTLTATDARTGRTRWQQHLPDGSCSAATVAGGLVHVTGVKGQLGAYRTEDGERVWYDDNAERYLALCAPSVADGTVYLGTGGGLAHAFDAATGRQRWGAEAGGTAIDHSPAVTHDLILVADFGTGVHALDRTTGMRRWHLPGPHGASAVTVSGSDAWVVTGPRRRVLLRLDPTTGTVHWRRTLDAPGSRPVHADGVVYATTAKGTVLALDALTGRRPALRQRGQRIP
ncbi:outer membrane protein assembly factor BamB [Streptomyces sp. 1114.5]|uniref:outer membrane protein assembly factor BamB family protein n=1 Tax=Streptomyces sp. 1114.5 TaxID=1938830 RepID=UPI000EAEF9B0|nr:PQQ-binding-like beta-propeller repeat protein [Streptomyces sp. 1114.5]RKT09405.1 outer membrane protein assembly factor BamB [Streptomyces sp. 1114.5]